MSEHLRERCRDVKQTYVGLLKKSNLDTRSVSKQQKKFRADEHWIIDYAE
jgi:hypothetical protein